MACNDEGIEPLIVVAALLIGCAVGSVIPCVYWMRTRRQVISGSIDDENT